MKVSAWYGGSKKNKIYGIRISRQDRDSYFQYNWRSIILEFDTGEIEEVDITSSFWKNCIELRHPQIGTWLVKHELAPWPKGEPPRLNLDLIDHNRFRLSRS